LKKVPKYTCAYCKEEVLITYKEDHAVICLMNRKCTLGCNFVGSSVDILNHLPNCSNAIVYCINCGKSLHRQQWVKHTTKHAYAGNILYKQNCALVHEGCEEVNPKIHHYNYCKYYQVRCIVCECIFDTKHEFYNHTCNGTNRKIKLVEVDLKSNSRNKRLLYSSIVYCRFRSSLKQHSIGMCQFIEIFFYITFCSFKELS